jgi:hypothetical protein
MLDKCDLDIRIEEAKERIKNLTTYRYISIVIELRNDLLYYNAYFHRLEPEAFVEQVNKICIHKQIELVKSFRGEHL